MHELEVIYVRLITDVIVTITLPHVSLEWLWEHIATLYGQLMTAGVKVHIAVDLPMEEDALLMP